MRANSGKGRELDEMEGLLLLLTMVMSSEVNIVVTGTTKRIKRRYDQ